MAGDKPTPVVPNADTYEIIFKRATGSTLSQCRASAHQLVAEWAATIGPAMAREY